MNWASAFLTLAAGAFFVPATAFFVECVAAWRANKPPPSEPTPVPFTILIPAHDEAAILGQTLRALTAVLPPTGNILVVADNCRDNTAHIARAAGADVVERNEPGRIGKGFALGAGLAALASSSPEVVIVLDADCRISGPDLLTLAATAAMRQRPVQAAYLLQPPARRSANDRISAFAFLVKNFVRPLGLHVLGQPCLLTGSGMAFPWPVVAEMSVATGHIVEDMNLGLELALGGHPPLFAPEVHVSGDLPHRQQHAFQQRTRWEHGHIHTTLTQVPRLLKAALLKRDAGLLALAAEQSIPPLALFVSLWMATAVAGLIHLLLLGPAPAIAWLALDGLLILGGVALAWFHFGRELLPGHTLLSVPGYILWKLPLYINYLLRRQTTWIRTERE